MGTGPVPCPLVGRQKIAPQRSVLNRQRHARRPIQGVRRVASEMRLAGPSDTQHAGGNEIAQAIIVGRVEAPWLCRSRKIVLWPVPEHVERAVVP